jgi:hypothetical protein
VRKSFIHDPKNKAKSVMMTDVGGKQAKEHFEKIFGKAV